PGQVSGGRHRLQQGAGAAVRGGRDPGRDRIPSGGGEIMIKPATPETPVPLSKKDFATDQEVRWCPGCGDYAILNAVQSVFPSLGVPKEKFVMVSGIGCSSRFPYYMNTYGFHTIHGRAPAVATGIKIANPELDVW